MGNSKTAKTRGLFMYRQYESNDVLYFYTVPVKLLGWAQAAGSYTPCYQQHLHHGWSDGCWRHRRRDDGCLLLEPDTCNLVFSNAQTISSIYRSTGTVAVLIHFILFLYYYFYILFIYFYLEEFCHAVWWTIKTIQLYDFLIGPLIQHHCFFIYKARLWITYTLHVIKSPSQLQYCFLGIDLEINNWDINDEAG